MRVRALSDREAEWADLMRAANAGDMVAYGRLLQILVPVLRAMARGAVARTGAKVDAEDIVQDTLLAIHLKRRTWIDSEPLGPWVRAIARHKLIDALRRRGRRAEIPIDGLEEVLPAEEESSDYPRRDLERHLDSLPPGQRAVVQAIALDGHSIRDAAGRLAMSEGAVRVALHRAIAGLARIMREGAA
jgi:RNA polymerase sigma-70 factor (ECF subfamily)